MLVWITTGLSSWIARIIFCVSVSFSGDHLYPSGQKSIHAAIVKVSKVVNDISKTHPIVAFLSKSFIFLVIQTDGVFFFRKSAVKL